jgi:hypothetical protein
MNVKLNTPEGTSNTPTFEIDKDLIYVGAVLAKGDVGMGSLTVGGVIKELLPEGSRPIAGSIPDWAHCPIWAPDVFAVAATLAERSGCYTEPGIVLSRNDRERMAIIKNAEEARRNGRMWSHKGSPPAIVRKNWTILVRAWADDVCAGVGNGFSWKKAAARLLAISDEACARVGLMPAATDSTFAWVVFNDLVASAEGKETLLHIPKSLTYLVSPDSVCVLPKSLTPAVGCTLRSLSHHLALLPGRGPVEAN